MRPTYLILTLSAIAFLATGCCHHSRRYYDPATGLVHSGGGGGGLFDTCGTGCDPCQGTGCDPCQGCESKSSGSCLGKLFHGRWFDNGSDPNGIPHRSRCKCGRDHGGKHHNHGHNHGQYHHQPGPSSSGCPCQSGGHFSGPMPSGVYPHSGQVYEGEVIYDGGMYQDGQIIYDGQVIHDGQVIYGGSSSGNCPTCNTHGSPTPTYAPESYPELLVPQDTNKPAPAPAAEPLPSTGPAPMPMSGTQWRRLTTPPAVYEMPQPLDGPQMPMLQQVSGQ